jgi:hypothetical protein
MQFGNGLATDEFVGNQASDRGSEGERRVHDSHVDGRAWRQVPHDWPARWHRASAETMSEQAKRTGAAKRRLQALQGVLCEPLQR